MRLTNTDQLKDEISQNLGIDAVAERLCGVDLMASGAQFKGLCPLHEEKTPSWQCNPTKGLYYCFGCQQGGDAIDLVRKTRHIGYYEALRVLAAEADIDIQRYERPPTEEEKEREQLEARVERWLDDLRPGAPRVADANVAAQFGVAVSDSGPDVGLPPGHFQGVVFPYRKPNGKLVGWKTREIDGKKMLGTPRDFAINGVTLFGIDVARKHLNNGELVLVEGEYDALACHCAGFKNVVALGGSNFSEAHMELLESIKVRTAIFALDGDEAGERAGKSIAESWWDNSEVGVKIATLPEGSDPEP
jgi:DNA primase